MDLSTADVPPPKERAATIGGFSFVPRLGLQIGGISGGTGKVECSGTFCSSITMSDMDYELSKAVAVSFDFLFKVGELFRIGPGLMYTNTMDVYPSKQSNHTELGNLTDIDFVAELIPRVGPSVWLVPRLQFGLTAYNASGTAETGEKENMDACKNQTGITTLVASNCTGVRLRVDGLLNYYSFGLGEITYTYDDGYSTPESARLKLSTSGTRFLLLAGMEI
jgi:hypothetical protein